MQRFQEIDWSPNWFSAGGSLTYKYQSPLEPLQLSSIVNTFLQPLQMFSENTLTDLRGREASRTLLQGPLISAGSFEFLLLKGKLTALSDAEVEEEFSVRVSTPFDKFVSGTHISHQLEKEISHADLKALPLGLLGYAMPIKLEFFRLGMAFYKPTRAGIFGVSPEVREELLIDCTEKEFSLELRSRTIEKKHALPQLQAGLMEWLELGLAGLFGVDLCAELQSYP